MKNKPDGLFFNRQFCAEAQNCCDRRGEITCVISPRGLSVPLRHGEKMEKSEEKRNENGGKKKGMPRILFTAPGSASGKTTVVCGFLAAVKRRGLKAASFKCGPDYIDPMFHRTVLGVEAGNLDPFFTDEDTTRYLLARKAKDADLTVLEGAMGYYDGLRGASDRASAYETGRITRTPAILILDAKGASVSLAAVARGILEFRPDAGIRGILLNRASASYYGRLKALLEKECGLPVLGFLPQLASLALPSRHLGLVMPQELEQEKSWAEAAADALEAYVDIDGILHIAEEAPVLEGEGPETRPVPGTVRLAVARDEAFSFYYEENLELLSRMGAELVPFSPLHDAALPERTDGLLLGGGYPECHAAALEANESMRRAVRKACENGLPCLAECGGFLYLQQKLEGTDGTAYRMAGVLSGEGYGTGRLQRFGYLEAENKTAGVLGNPGQRMKGHEFHHWDCTRNGEDFLAYRPSTEGEEAAQKGIPCMIHTPSMAAGFPHFYYYSNPDMIREFLLSCLRFQAGREAKARWDGIAKPIDSLGLLEEMVGKLCRIAGSPLPYKLNPRALVIFCGDHGVVQEGVTQTGSEVTRIVSENFAAGRSTVNLMAQQAGADVYTIDVGMDTEAYPEKELVTGAVIDRKVARGSGNIAREAAMSRIQCEQALRVGIETARALKKKGYRILATGEMGIGNTTPTSALAALFLNQDAETVTGKGAGLSSDGMKRKRQAVQRTVGRVKRIGCQDALEILAQAGGFEIAAMAGLFLGGVQSHIPVLIDGAISAAAAYAASQIDPRVPEFCLASHRPKEAAGALLLNALGLSAPVDAGLCLGEGTGAVAALPLLDMAMAVYEGMGTFTEYEIPPYERYETQEG